MLQKTLVLVMVGILGLLPLSLGESSDGDPDRGPATEPDGLTADRGPGTDPNGLTADHGPMIEPNGLTAKHE